jgi:hypothetical protein
MLSIALRPSLPLGMTATYWDRYEPLLFFCLFRRPAGLGRAERNARYARVNSAVFKAYRIQPLHELSCEILGIIFVGIWQATDLRRFNKRRLNVLRPRAVGA